MIIVPFCQTSVKITVTLNIDCALWQSDEAAYVLNFRSSLATCLGVIMFPIFLSTFLSSKITIVRAFFYVDPCFTILTRNL
jgi:hypothetical protein